MLRDTVYGLKKRGSLEVLERCSRLRTGEASVEVGEGRAQPPRVPA